MIHKKIVDNKLSLMQSRFISVEDTEMQEGVRHMYHQEFVQFFEIREQMQLVKQMQ